jgi:hypothetical protein
MTGKGKEILAAIRRSETIAVALPELAIVLGAVVCGVGLCSDSPTLTRVGLSLIGGSVIPSSVVIYAATHPEVSQQKLQGKP